MKWINISIALEILLVLFGLTTAIAEQTTYNSRPYDLTYAAKLIEKETSLIEHIDFEFLACPPAKTIINFLRAMTKEETDSVQALFDTPIIDDVTTQAAVDAAKDEAKGYSGDITISTITDSATKTALKKLCGALKIECK